VTRSPGQCAIDGVEIGDVSISILDPRQTAVAGPMLAAKYALVSTASGTRFGAGNRNQWSDATMEKLSELLLSMEQDVCRDLFEGHPTDGVSAQVGDPEDGVPGL
jgi:hypothetical protein